MDPEGTPLPPGGQGPNEPTDLRAAELLRWARRRVAMYQSELAERAGVRQAQVSLYESGRRQPSLPTLTRLIEATDTELIMTIDAIPRHLRGLDSGIDLAVRRTRHDLARETDAVGFDDLAYLPGRDEPARFVVATFAAGSSSERVALEQRFRRVLGVDVQVTVLRRGETAPREADPLVDRQPANG